MALIQIWWTRFHFLDDAFIHLRIAENLIESGQFTFNESISSYATSSPFYTALLACVLLITKSIFAPKAINIAVYLVILFVVARLAVVSKNQVARVLLLIWLTALVSPIGIRWLTDGMETGLVALAAIGLGVVIGRLSEGEPEHLKPSHTFGLFVLGFAVATLRIEFIFLISLAVSPLWISRLIAHRHVNSVFKGGDIALVGGAVTALFIIKLSFGAILPDTAVAKSLSETNQSFAAYEFVRSIIQAHAAASYFSVITSICLLIVVGLCLQRNEMRLYVFVYIAGFFTLVLAIILRQQIIQGYRYFIFIEFFIAQFCIYRLARIDASATVLTGFLPRTWDRIPVYVAIICAAAALAYDLRRMSVINQGRSETLIKFTELNLAQLRGLHGVAWDVGMIGYFSKGQILDPNGLVNGRQFAALSRIKRLNQICQSKDIKFIFVNTGQLEAIRKCIDTDGWVSLGAFNFPNFSGHLDTHWLFVSPM